jgi:hypothetical protein
MLTACTDTNSADSSVSESVNSDSVTESVTAQDDSSAADTSATDTPESSQSDSATDSADDSSQTEPSDITPAMWTVTSDSGVTITMLGSMHALKDADYPMPDKIMNAYNSADILAVECDTAEAETATYQLSLLKEMVYSDGDTLENHLTSEAYTALSDYLETAGMDISTFAKYKPWAIYSTLDTFAMSEAGLSSQLGVDSYFLDLAHSEDKTIYEVESVDFQMDLLMNMSDEIYSEALLAYEGETVESQSEMLNEMYEAWRTGDIDTVLELNEGTAEEGEEISPEEQAIIDDYNNQMLYDRNIGMENSVKELLDGDSDVFYVVGAAHFVGDGGIIDLLEKDGYTVTRVE